MGAVEDKKRRVMSTVPSISESVSQVFSNSRLPGNGNNFLFDLKHSGGPRLYFLAYDSTHKSSLFYVPVSADSCEWKPALNFSKVKKDVKMSKEEELLRERMRMNTIGISSYSLHAASRQMVIPSSGSLYTFDLEKDTPSELVTKEKGARLDPKWSPDALKVSFIR